MFRNRSAAVALLLVPFAALLFSQTPSIQAAPNPPIVIVFIGNITGDSIQKLMGIVTTQVSKGTNDITIAISSPGGDTGAAFGAYNALHAMENQAPHTKITTVNIGTVASAAVILFCAGNQRYSLPNANFLIHGNGMDVPAGTHMEANTLKNTLDFVTSLNDETIHIISSTTNKKKTEIEAAVGNQIVLDAKQAKDWNLVQDIRQTFAPTNATVLTVNAEPPEEIKPPLQVTSTSTATAK